MSTPAPARAPPDHFFRVVEGPISVAGQPFESGRMMVFRPGDRISVAADPAGARLDSRSNGRARGGLDIQTDRASAV